MRQQSRPAYYRIGHIIATGIYRTGTATSSRVAVGRQNSFTHLAKYGWVEGGGLWLWQQWRTEILPSDREASSRSDENELAIFLGDNATERLIHDTHTTFLIRHLKNVTEMTDDS